MENFLDTVDRLAKAEDPFSLTAEIDSFSRISVESRQLVEIIDIKDELNIIKSILTTQQTVLEQFQNLVGSHGDAKDSRNPTDVQDAKDAKNEKTTGSAKRHGSTGFNSVKAIDESIRTVKDNLLRVSEMNESAQRVHDEVSSRFQQNGSQSASKLRRSNEKLKQLLEFKQQQASGWESRYAMKLSEQGQRQNTVWFPIQQDL
jgi:hypothetical protein